MAGALLAAAACGLQVSGLAPPPDAGAGAGAGADGGAADGTDAAQAPDTGGADGGGDAADAATVSCATVSTDPLVKKCLDFDTPPSSSPSTFGFDALVQHKYLDAGLSASPLGPSAKQGLFIDIADPVAEDHSAVGEITIRGYPGITRVVLDVDMTIDSGNMAYANLVGLRFEGSSCGTYAALNVGDDGADLFAVSGTPSGSSRGPSLTRGKPFHVHLEASPAPGGTTQTSIAVDGVALSPVTNTYASSCNMGLVWLGAWFTSQASGESLHVRFDQVVLRTQ
jgi:hypothetical protein